MQKKRVLVKSYCGWYFDPDYQVGWEDIGLKLHFPKSRVLFLSACLIGRKNLLHDIEINQSCADDPKNKDLRKSFEETVNHLQGILKRVDDGEVVIDGEQDKKKMHQSEFIHNIFTNKEWINRKDAEEMLDFYLKWLGVKNPVKYVWKRPKMIISPVTL